MTGVHTSAPPRRLAQLALPPLVTIEDSQSLWDAWQLMFMSGLRQLAVVNSEGRYVGVIADRAVLADLPLVEEHLSRRPVAGRMTTPTPVHPDHTLVEAARIVAHAESAFAPLIARDGRLVAIVTAADLLHWWATP